MNVTLDEAGDSKGKLKQVVAKAKKVDLEGWLFGGVGASNHQYSNGKDDEKDEVLEGGEEEVSDLANNLSPQPLPSLILSAPASPSPPNFETIDLETTPAPSYTRSDSNASNMSGLSDELNGSVDSIDLRRSFQESMDDFRSPLPANHDNLTNNDDDHDPGDGGENDDRGHPSMPLFTAPNPECTSPLARSPPTLPSPPPAAASPILKKQKSEPLKQHAKSVEFRVPEASSEPEQTQSAQLTPLDARKPPPTTSSVFNASVEATLKEQQLTLERRRANSLASENESLRLLIHSLKQKHEDVGDESSGIGSSVVSNSTILVIENLRQSNSLLQSKVEELAQSNSTLEGQSREKSKQLSELSVHHAEVTDQLSSLAQSLHEKSLDVKHTEEREEGLRLHVAALKKSIEELGTELGTWKLKYTDAEHDKLHASASLQKEIDVLKGALEEKAAQQAEKEKQLKIEGAKQRKEKAQQRNLCASLQLQLREMKKELAGEKESATKVRSVEIDTRSEATKHCQHTSDLLHPSLTPSQLSERNSGLQSKLDKTIQKLSEVSSESKEAMNMRIVKLVATEADNGRLRTSLDSEEKKGAKFAATVRELKKELTRSKAQVRVCDKGARTLEILSLSRRYANTARRSSRECRIRWHPRTCVYTITTRRRSRRCVKSSRASEST